MTRLIPPERRPLRFPAALARRLAESGATVAVTGGSGWMGLALLEMLANAFGKEFSSRVRVFGRQARRITLRDGRVIESQALDQLANLGAGPVLLFHLAFLTRDKTGQMSLADYVAANRELSTTVLSAARRLDLRGLFTPSSGAVYEADRSLSRDLQRNPYGVLKLEDEAAFASLAEQLGIPAAVPRVFNLAGPYINKPEAYVLASILRDLLDGSSVKLSAACPVYRSYVHIADVLSLGVAELTATDPRVGTSICDTAGETEIEVGDLAVRCARLLGATLTVERPDWQQAPTSRYVGDRGIFLQACERNGLTPVALDSQILDTAADLALALDLGVTASVAGA